MATAAALLIAAVYLFPLYWMYVTAFKGHAEIYRMPPSFWPEQPVSSIGRVLRDHGIGHYRAATRC